MKPWVKNLLFAGGLIALVYGMIYADVVMRARHAYLEGEKYWRWAEHPEERLKILDDQLARRKAELDAKLAQGALSREQYEHDVELAEFDREQAGKESNLKYAYIWYQTTVELFSPPESRWVRLARAKMPIAKDRWKAELKSNHIPFEEYMLE